MDKRKAYLEYMREYRREARRRDPQKAHLDNRRAYEKRLEKLSEMTEEELKEYKAQRAAYMREYRRRKKHE